jgi:hypothetical protein
MNARCFILSLALTLGGCLAIPHLDERSPQVSGSVVDAATRQPVSGAKVEFVENPALAVLTNERGEFVIRATMKPELFVPIGGNRTDFNIGARIEPKLRVTMEGYTSVEVDASRYENLESNQSDLTWSGQQLVGPRRVKPVVLDRLLR